MARFVNPFEREQLVSELKLRSRVSKLVRAFGREKLVSWLNSRSSATKLRAASNQPFWGSED